jgi:hypothetical protein
VYRRHASKAANNCIDSNAPAWAVVYHSLAAALTPNRMEVVSVN